MRKTILIIILIIVVITGALYFIGKNSLDLDNKPKYASPEQLQQAQNEINKLKNKVKNDYLSTDLSSRTILDTKLWKVFNDLDNKFSFIYPNDKKFEFSDNSQFGFINFDYYFGSDKSSIFKGDIQILGSTDCQKDIETLSTVLKVRKIKYGNNSFYLRDYAKGNLEKYYLINNKDCFVFNFQLYPDSSNNKLVNDTLATLLAKFIIK